jgi:hypothetical protein
MTLVYSYLRDNTLDLRAEAHLNLGRKRFECCLPGPSASPKRPADIHSPRLRFFVVSRSSRPRRAAYAHSR